MYLKTIDRISHAFRFLFIAFICGNVIQSNTFFLYFRCIHNFNEFIKKEFN